VKTSVSTKGQIVLPAEIRRQDDVQPGQEFDIERIDRGEYRLLRRTPRPNEGVVDWLLGCPDKGYFVPIESDSTETL
jgi:AbrB family looped-hinge helix DNA binding protein